MNAIQWKQCNAMNVINAMNAWMHECNVTSVHKWLQCNKFTAMDTMPVKCNKCNVGHYCSLAQYWNFP